MPKSWLDLSAYNLKIAHVAAPKGHYLAIGGASVKDHVRSVAALGFRLNGPDSDLLAKEMLGGAGDSLFDYVNGEQLRRVFPLGRKIDFDASQHFVDRTGFVKPAPGQAATQAAAPGPATVAIGVNRLGTEVFETEGRRWVRDERANPVYEDESTPDKAPLFLRAGNSDESRIQCAEGLVERAWRSKVITASDFETFLKVVSPAPITDAVRAEFRKAAREAMYRWLARRGGKTMQECFIAAGKLVANMAFFASGEDLVLPPLPLAVAAQRTLGTEASVRGKKIVLSSEVAGAFATNLSKAADVTLYRKGTAINDAAVLQAAGLKGASIGSGAPDFDAFAFIFDHRAETKDGRRNDYILAEDALAQRSEDGVAVFVLDVPRNEEESAQFEAFRSRIAASYVFEGEAHVDGTTWAGVADAPAKMMLSVGRRLDEVNADVLPPLPTSIADWSSLWTWTAEVYANRTRNRRIARSEEKDVTFNAGEGERNTYQTPYVSVSSVGAPRTMVPRNLEGATRGALATVVRQYGDIDVFVANEYGYTREELAEYFSPEQVDAMALHVHAENRGRGFLNGDQTGIGKGRFLAAVMRRRVLKGGKAVFFTEREQNLSDIWRDIVNTGSAHLFKPLILNADAAIIDFRSKETVLRGAPRDQVDAMTAAGEIPDDINLVMGTYSQVNRDISVPVPAGERDQAAKSRWVREAMASDVLLVMDECHNAAGESNVSDNMGVAMTLASSVVFSSATYAADAKRMAFYAPLFPDDLSVSELSAMMAKGNEPFQEVLSAMLAADGVTIRREFDLSKVKFETVVDTARFERNRELMDMVAPILYELSAISSVVDAKIRNLNADMAGRAAAAENNGKRKFKITRNGFGSPLYTISRLFVAALKVDVVAEDAIKVLQTGGKPIILVENTMQQLFEELAEMDTMEQAGAPERDVQGVSVDLTALFNRILRNMVTVSHVNAKGERIYTDVTTNDPALAADIAHIRRMAAKLPPISLSVIDDVKRRIEEAGFTAGEITGRTLEVRNGRIMKRAPVHATVVKNEFNEGILDAIVINVSGATGIDLHASKTFQDQRQRFMLELQPPADVVRKMQARGRPNRYDQVIEPVIRTYLSGLPVEMRLAAMENAKLRRLSANTTSNRDAAQLTRDIPDLINPIGDVVCSNYAESRPELMRRLGFRIGEVENASKENEQVAQNAAVALLTDLKPAKEGKTKRPDQVYQVSDNSRTANEILARLIMLPVDLQAKVCDELVAEFNALIEEMEARGETPLKTNELAGIIHPRQRDVFDGSETESPDSIFHEPLYVVEAVLERVGDPVRSEDLAQRIDLGELASGRSQPCLDRIRNGMDEILEAYLPEGVASVADAVARNIVDVVARRDKLIKFADTLEKLRPGCEIRFTLDGEEVGAIVTRIEYPIRGYEHVTGMYGVEFAKPGDEKPRIMRIETLMKDAAFDIREGLESEKYSEILKQFDDAVLSKLSKVHLLTHNIFRAMRLNVEYNFGPLVTYRTADGVAHRGVAVAKRHWNLQAVPVEITSPDMAVQAISDNIELNAASGLDEKTFLIKSIGYGAMLRLPPRTSRKYGHIYDNPQILGLVHDKEPDGKKGYVVEVATAVLPDIMNALYSVGARFWTISGNREWATKYMREKEAAVEPRQLARM